MRPHEIPTHLGVEDKAFLGLTLRQLMTAAIGMALAYGAAGQLPLPAPLRLTVAAVVLIGVGLLALWQPAGRPLETWAFVLLQYAATARVAVWRPGDGAVPDGEDASPAVVVRLPARPLPDAGSPRRWADPADARSARRLRDA